MDMLCLMFESGRRGYREHATGKPVNEDQLAWMTGCSARQVSRLLRELEDSGVFSRTDDDTIFSRRMVKDEAIRQAKSAAGKLVGNPRLVGGVDNPQVTTRSSRRPSREEFAKLKPDRDLLDTMLEAIDRQRQAAAWRKEGERFIPHPASWLANRQWEDVGPGAGAGSVWDDFIGDQERKVS